MPKKDIYHDQFIKALVSDGWTITHDPYYIRVDGISLYIDIGAEKNTFSEQETSRKIGAEVKNFVSISDMNELQKAIGQYTVYQEAFKRKDPDRELFLAIPSTFYKQIQKIRLYSDSLNANQIKIVVFNESSQTVEKWIE